MKPYYVLMNPGGYYVSHLGYNNTLCLPNLTVTRDRAKRFDSYPEACHYYKQYLTAWAFVVERVNDEEDQEVPEVQVVE